jgi:DNA-binding CsgD family transcriptional regulator
MDILQLMVEGHSDKVIADLLFISPLTVNSHIKRIYEKLHVHSKPQAVSTALRNRLV